MTKENEMLDLICWRHYGFTDGIVELVLQTNSGLAEYGSFLPAGLKIKLPVVEEPLKNPFSKCGSKETRI